MTEHPELPPHFPRRPESYELVGPMVPFRQQMVAVTSSPPRDTRDPRWRQCTAHHLACDCREAEKNEQIDEMRAELRIVRQALAAAIVGHPTFVYVDSGPYSQSHRRRRDIECKCIGCDLARRMKNEGTYFYENVVYVNR